MIVAARSGAPGGRTEGVIGCGSMPSSRTVTLPLIPPFAYGNDRDAEIPEDLQDVLDANPAAAEHFENLSNQNRFAILFRISNVKRADTRAKKISVYVEMLARGETLH